MDAKCNYELTEYPKIFKEVWWGVCGKYRGEYALPEIVSNRNAFVKEHNIVKHKLANKRLLRKILLEIHTNSYETYEDNMGRIVIICNTDKVASADLMAKINRPTWTQIDPMFTCDKRTTIRKYETDKSDRLSKINN